MNRATAQSMRDFLQMFDTLIEGLRDDSIIGLQYADHMLEKSADLQAQLQSDETIP